jgi:hypothetical protein
MHTRQIRKREGKKEEKREDNRRKGIEERKR